jgi:D-isomer specific 2-hydroxyacid dehydrogenase, NAD binding domain
MSSSSQRILAGQKLIDADALGRMKPSAYLLNAARGRVVDEPALVDALARRQVRGAALDVTVEEPLPVGLAAVGDGERAHHTAGETRRYEDSVLAIMQENLTRLWRGETELQNQVVQMIVIVWTIVFWRGGRPVPAQEHGHSAGVCSRRVGFLQGSRWGLLLCPLARH